VTKAWIELDVPLSESSSMRATEQALPDVTGWVSSDEPFHATISIACDDVIAEITVTDELEICSTVVE
jgi:hypothetical protein